MRRKREVEDAIVAVMVRLDRINDALGEAALAEASQRALHVIGKVAMEIAEARASRSSQQVVVPFPGPRNRK